MQFKFSHKCNFGFLKIELFKNSCHSKDFQKPYFCIYILAHKLCAFFGIIIVCWLLIGHRFFTVQVTVPRVALAYSWQTFRSVFASPCGQIYLQTCLKKTLYMWTASVSFLEKSSPFCWRKHAWIWMFFMCKQICMITKHWRYTVICTETCLPVDDGITRSLVDFQVGRFNARFMILI